RLLRAVESGDHRVELLAHLETVGTLFVAVAAEVGALDEAGRTVFAGLDFQAAVADFEDGYGNHFAAAHRTARSGRAAGSGRTLFTLLHAQADAFLLDIDVAHHGLAFLALAVECQSALARDAPGDVGHVGHAADVAVQ